MLFDKCEVVIGISKVVLNDEEIEYITDVKVNDKMVIIKSAGTVVLNNNCKGKEISIYFIVKDIKTGNIRHSITSGEVDTVSYTIGATNSSTAPDNSILCFKLKDDLKEDDFGSFVLTINERLSVIEKELAKNKEEKAKLKDREFVLDVKANRDILVDQVVGKVAKLIDESLKQRGEYKDAIKHL